MSLLSGYCLPNGGSGATPQLFLIIWAVSPPFQNPIGTGHESPLAWMHGGNLRREEILAFMRFILFPMPLVSTSSGATALYVL